MSPFVRGTSVLLVLGLSACPQPEKSTIPPTVITVQQAEAELAEAIVLIVSAIVSYFLGHRRGRNGGAQ